MKTFLAVLAGLVFTVALSTGLDLIMHAKGVFPEEVSGMTASDWVVATSYRLFAAIGGGWITARLARSRPVFWAVVLGSIGTALGLLGFIGAWIASPKLGPLWYPALLVVTAVPCTWLGAKLNRRSPPAAVATAS